MNSPASSRLPLAPELQVGRWLNTPSALRLDALRGRVVVLHAFQMLCPGCVSHGVPQATALHEAFAGNELTVIGLHTVFEHHAVMNEAALRAFVHEYRLAFPIGIDMAGRPGGVPRTMEAYGLRGTPSLVLIDRSGHVRLNHFGRIDDLRLGSMVGTLLAEDAPEHAAEVVPQPAGSAATDARCTDEACAVDSGR